MKPLAFLREAHRHMPTVRRIFDRIADQVGDRLPELHHAPENGRGGRFPLKFKCDLLQERAVALAFDHLDHQPT